MGSLENTERTTWYVVFTAEDVAPHWLHKYLKKPFYHCYCFRQIGDAVFWANATTANIDSKIQVGVKAEELANQLRCSLKTLVLTFSKEYNPENKLLNVWNLPPTCVSVVKMFLGITSKAVTPYQLYKHLLKQGAVEDLTTLILQAYGQQTESTR